ncbi:hypothetical protein ACIPY2_20180 [Paenarthrobacter sp. NPDC089675]|uniref:hypothetical protein n=1 Tax=Paenarthrobacter sp. NPDC089675 TaxID=3364376 RepID=UPI0038153144
MPRFSPARLFLSARFAAAAFAVGTMLFLGGCQGGNPPSAPGTTTATPTVTASGPGIPSLTITTPSGVYKPADSKGKRRTSLFL